MHQALEAISNPRRRQILRLVWDREASAGELAAASDVTWPAVSQNLNILREAGLVKQRKVGRHRFYKAERSEIGPLTEALKAMWTEDLYEMKTLAEAEARRTKKGGK